MYSKNIKHYIDKEHESEYIMNTKRNTSYNFPNESFDSYSLDITPVQYYNNSISKNSSISNASNTLNISNYLSRSHMYYPYSQESNSSIIFIITRIKCSHMTYEQCKNVADIFFTREGKRLIKSKYIEQLSIKLYNKEIIQKKIIKLGEYSELDEID